MKLSFSLSSKSSSRPNRKFSQNLNNEDQVDKDTSTHEYVTEFDASKTLTDSQSKKFIIPPKENEWRPLKKMKNLDVPVRLDGQNLQFEVESSSVAETIDSNISFGLNLRQSTTSTKNDADVEHEFNGDDERPRYAPIENVMLQKLKDDLKSLPEDRGLEEFNDVPVEGFGAALLAGYGWYEGRGIGKNAKEDVKVVQYEKRTAKEGLGFVSDMHTKKDKEKERQMNTKKHKEKEGNNERGFFVGKEVRIVGTSRDAGLKGRIVDILGGGDLIRLKLLRSGEEVEVHSRNIAELGSREDEECLRKLKELKVESRRHRESKHEEKRKDHKQSRGEEERRGSSRREEERTNQVSWLASHIRVRFISKDFQRGQLYLKKGEVVEVVGPTTCDIYMDECRELIQGVDQDLLETVVPRRGGPVLVLYGKHKGAYGNLVERDMHKETGIVRDADTHALLNVHLEQIAEYIGDPSYIGY